VIPEPTGTRLCTAVRERIAGELDPTERDRMLVLGRREQAVVRKIQDHGTRLPDCHESSRPHNVRFEEKRRDILNSRDLSRLTLLLAEHPELATTKWGSLARPQVR
jgi:hypothetical protein